jgi:peptidoglycan/xylan/chitin deacetylase (PgdA/CDA1 family)
MKNKYPIVTFTFDDFPRSAYLAGAEILDQFGFKATYYVSLGLMGKKLPVGDAFIEEDILNLIYDGHELGCHTFDHYESWKTKSNEFNNSIKKNTNVFKTITSEIHFKSFSYPKTNPSPTNKAIAGKNFDSCRAGGQINNLNQVDLNLLRSYFIDKRNNRDITELKDLVDRNTEENGWLIISTHDISDTPSKFGCSIEYFKEIVDHIANKNIKVLKTAEVVERYCL